MSAVAKLRAVTAALGAATEPRPQQERMAALVESALAERRPLAVQAGTGVGKTFGYLTPAIAWARAENQKIVVVTSSIALQDQLARKDLPFLREHHPDPFTFVVLKGRANYLCDAALADVGRALAREAQGQLDLAAPGDGDGGGSGFEAVLDQELLGRVDRGQLTRIIAWSGTTAVGDRAELGRVLDAEPDPATWAAVSVAPGACPGADRCAHGRECRYEKQRRAAYGADVIVVNAHLYGAHLALDGGLLPAHGAVIVDEAHEFVDAVIGALSVELSRGRVAQVARVVRSVLAEPPAELRQLEGAAQHVDETLRRMIEARDTVGRPRRLAGGMSEDDDLVDAVVALLPPLVALTSNLREVRDRVATLDPSAGGRIDGAIVAVTGLHADITDRLLEPPDRKGEVVYLEGSDRFAAVKATSITVGARLRTIVWDEGVVPILTSATLPPSIPAGLGLPDAEWVDVGTPFPFREHALLYVPKHFPEPRGATMDRWRALATAELLDIIEAAGGRTLALFTTSRAVGDAAAAARARFPDLRILAQGELPKAELTERFIADETSCLFATASFWTGIDAQGATLRAVVIDKLPFPVPSDPIIQAKEELVGADDAFGLVSVPAAAVQLAQGAGRLIRTATDQGVVAVLDPRLATKAYRTQILACLPPMKRTIDRDEVLSFLRSLRGHEAPDADH